MFFCIFLYWSLLVGQVMNSLLTSSLTHDQLPFMNLASYSPPSAAPSRLFLNLLCLTTKH